MTTQEIVDFLKDRRLFSQALNALEKCHSDEHWRERYDAICALRARLERIEDDPYRDRLVQRAESDAGRAL